VNPEELESKLSDLTDTLNNCEIELGFWHDSHRPKDTVAYNATVHQIQARIETVEWAVSRLWELFASEGETH